MKLHEVTIKNIRGIKDLTLNPKGKNLVIWGLNGSGKSAVVDAIDFLFTGRMNRLEGDGTRGISLKTHGPHVDCTDLKDSKINAVVRCSGSDHDITISRSLENPAAIHFASDSERAALSEPLLLADRGQHILTRREILQFVTARGKDRATQMQALLNISEVESIRSCLVTTANNAKKNFNSAKANFGQATKDVASTIGVSDVSEGGPVLDFINDNRSALSAEPLPHLVYSGLTKNIHPPDVPRDDSSLNPSIILPVLKRLGESIENALLEESEKLIEDVRVTIQKINSDPVKIRHLKSKQLIELGINLVGDSDQCPLCDLEWPPGTLVPYLKTKQENAQDASARIRELNKKADKITEIAQTIISDLKPLIGALQRTELVSDATVLSSWKSQLDEIVQSCSHLKENYELQKLPPSFATVFPMPASKQIIESVFQKIKLKEPKPSPQRTAWDRLTRLEENLKVYERQKRAFINATDSQKYSSILLTHFTNSRDAILEGLYDQVRGKFIKLYRELHGEDESEFDAAFEPTAAGLKFEVDFYGRGKHPPHALHSEGHQDSMGVCLFLALADQLAKDKLDIVILDDVVMSVDIEHRRQLCEVLANNFPNRQFIITTHDQTWAQMLRAQRVVDSKGLKEFFSWTVDTGPNVMESSEVWEKIEADLKSSDVSSAAARLRRGSEQFFTEVCELLHCTIKFKSNKQWDLGDLGNAAIGGLSVILKKAAKSAHSWGESARKAEIEEFSDRFAKAIDHSNIERWPINPLVHYNRWISLTPSEFRIVVSAFYKLFAFYLCQKPSGCGLPLYVTSSGPTVDAFRCKCGDTNWTLNSK